MKAEIRAEIDDKLIATLSHMTLAQLNELKQELEREEQEYLYINVLGE